MDIAMNYIGGTWQEKASTDWFESINPANGQVIGKSVMSNEQDVDQAVAAAQAAFETWKRVPAPQRAELLYQIVDRLQEHKEELAKIMTQEMGKIYAETLGELNVVITYGRYMAGEGYRMMGETLPSGGTNRMVMTIREPLGVVGCITPWNYPVALAAYKIFAALIAGNTVVWKPASNVALSAKRFVEVVSQTDLPKGVINLVFGSGSTVGRLLAEHPDVKVIAFTGSTAVGIQLAEQGAKTLKRVSLELGGKNAVIVLRDADLDQAAQGIVQSAFGTTGQRCTAASRVIVEESIQEELEEKLLQRIQQLRIGDGLAEGVDMGPLATQQQLETVESYIEIAKKEGGKIRTGGHRLTEGELKKGYFFAPTLINQVLPTHRVAREEVFGPVLAVITARDLDHAIAINNDTEYGLSTAIYTQSLHAANVAMREIDSGLVYINSGTSNAEVGMPFGGSKLSGNGHREVSHHALDVMTEWKTIYTNY